MDGVALGRQIRRQMPVPLILLSSFGDPVEGEDARLFNVQIPKPIRHVDLLNALLRITGIESGGRSESVTAGAGRSLAADHPLLILLAEDNLVNQRVCLLMLARFDSNETPEARERCDLARIAAESVVLLEPLADENNVRISMEADPVQCQGNAAQLAQAVGNIVSNAIHYNRPGGSVRVTVHPEAGGATLTVTDTGQGIAPRDLPHIFERFYRAEKARSSEQGHSGLGLAIAKAIVEKHGGTIDVASEPGEGTTFRVRFAVSGKTEA